MSKLSLSVVPKPRVIRDLDDIADSIRAHWTATEEDRFAIGRDLVEARAQFPGDTEFGQWLAIQGFPFSSQWGRTLRLAAENELPVRAALESQLASGKPANIEKAVKAVLHPEPIDITPKEETPTDSAPDPEAWRALTEVMDAIETLSSSDASYLAATVPSRRRAATARRLRKLGSYLGRIAWSLEGQGTSE